MKHTDNIKHYDDVEVLAEALGDLYYDSLADFLNLFSDKILRDGNADMRRNRPELSGHLMECSKHLEAASTEIQKAWEICKPHVWDENKKENMKNNKQKNSRSRRSSLAHDTVKIIEKGYYEVANQQVLIKDKVAFCDKNTRLYTPNDLAELAETTTVTSESKIEVVNETTLQGAKRLFDSGSFKRIGVLNFASAKNAGGGFLGGSQAQEESLARSSALFSSLQQCPSYYDYHRRKNKSLLYSDHMIYSPQCVVFRDDTGALIAEPYQVDFITAPAPNRGAIARNEPKALARVDEIFTRRIQLMLRLAANQGCDALVLGAWGCGVFANVPDKVAEYFASALKGEEAYARFFKQMSFSIPENPKSAVNIEAFKAVLLSAT